MLDKHNHTLSEWYFEVSPVNEDEITDCHRRGWRKVGMAAESKRRFLKIWG